MSIVRRPTSRTMRAAAIVALAVLAGCSSASSSNATPGLRAPSITVVTTTTQLTDFVRSLGGDEVQVYSVLQANDDPHDYKPTAADIEAISGADVIVRNGVGLERWFDATIKRAKPKGSVVDASAGVAIRSSDPRGGGTPAPDPHIWMNPQNVKVMVGTIAAALQAADPPHAGTYADRLADYRAKLDALDVTITGELRDLASRKVVTNHDALGYYIDHYGLIYVGAVIPSFDTQAELSAADITDLVTKIGAEHVQAVFAEASLPPKSASAIAQQAGVKVVEGADALFADTLGPEGSDADTYLKMMAHDTRVLVDNLGAVQAG